MDWSSFIPTLLATFTGVFLSFGAYRLWDWYKAKQQKATTKHILALEIIDNLGTLKAARTQANDVINGKGNIQTLCSSISTIHTLAYNAAFQRGDVHRMGDSILEGVLIKYAWSCESYNFGVRWLGEIVKEKFGFGDVPLEIAQTLVQPRLPLLDKLISRSLELLKMLDADVGEVDTSSAQSSG